MDLYDYCKVENVGNPFKYFLINKLQKKNYFLILPELQRSAIVLQSKKPNVRIGEPF